MADVRNLEAQIIPATLNVQIMNQCMITRNIQKYANF